jgi:hypothetical protein
MIRKIAMLTAVVGALAGLGATSAMAQDDVTRQSSPAGSGCSSGSIDGGTTCSGGSGSPTVTSQGVASVSLAGTTLWQNVTYPTGEKVTRCTKAGSDAGWGKCL